MHKYLLSLHYIGSVKRQLKNSRYKELPKTEAVNTNGKDLISNFRSYNATKKRNSIKKILRSPIGSTRKTSRVKPAIKARGKTLAFFVKIKNINSKQSVIGNCQIVPSRIIPSKKNKANITGFILLE